jgi:ZIP family zinc transporter
VSLSVLAAVFISNLPEGLSSAAGMKNAGRSARYVLGIWGAIAVSAGISAAVGYLWLDGASGATLAVINAVAAGAILTMIADTMIPEAFEKAQIYTGLITAGGFLVALSLTMQGG